MNLTLTDEHDTKNMVVCILRHQIQDDANYDQLAPNFDIATIQRVSVPNLNLFGQMKIKLRAKEFGELFIMLHGKMGSWALFCLPTWLQQI